MFVITTTKSSEGELKGGHGAGPVPEVSESISSSMGNDPMVNENKPFPNSSESVAKVIGSHVRSSTVVTGVGTAKACCVKPNPPKIKILANTGIAHFMPSIIQHEIT